MKNQYIHIIGGTGQMGTWLTSFLESHAFHVSVSNRNNPNESAVRTADIVIFSVPIDQIAKIIENNLPIVKKDVLLLDISSVMMPGKEILRASTHHCASLHFLFGPSITDITNQHIVFSPIHSRELFNDFLALFKDKGAHITEMKASKHDHLMAHIQALTHFSNLALAETLKHNGIGLIPSLTTPTFLSQLSLITRVLTNNSAELLATIQTKNPVFREVLSRHIKTQQQLLSLISRNERKTLTSIYGALKENIIPQTREKYPEPKPIEGVFLAKDSSLAYLGPEGTFSHQAAQHINKKGTLHPEETFYDIFKSVADGKADFGIIPAENSIEGTIRETLDYLLDFKVEVKYSYTLPVTQSLLSDEKELTKITRIFSHPQALAQSSLWLKEHLPAVKLIPAKSTISEVEKERHIPGTAFIGSEIASKTYGLTILQTHIEERRDNVTKFYIIAKKEKTLLTQTTRTLLFLSIFNRVGILKDILNIFASFGINLNKIESRPSHEKVWDYYFFIEIEIARTDPRITQILSLLKLFCPEIKILGEL